MPQGVDEVSLVILAGGLGTRLGRDKAELLLGGERLVDRALRRMAWLGPARIVVTRRGQALQVAGVRLVADAAPYEGILAGLAAGLRAATTPWILALGCDMPFVQQGLVEMLLTRRDACDAVVPRLAVGIEPLHALYHQGALGAIEAAMQQGERRARVALDRMRVTYVDEDLLAQAGEPQRSFFNINTPEDLARAQALVEGERKA